MLVNMRNLLSEATKGGYAVGAFNFSTLESGRAAVEAAEETGCPFILQHAPAHEEYCPLDVAGPIMLQLARAAKVPVAVHLDHGTDFALCRHALEMGFTSVMIDSSALPFEENVAAAAAVVSEARRHGADVEAELGSMPNNLKGQLGEYAPEDFYTKPEEAARFVAETGVDALAISFGTVHGVYKAKPKLSLEVVERVCSATGGLPLVMHGGSGLSGDDYRNAISRGIRKINYYTYGAIAGGKAVAALVRERGEGLQFHDVAVAATDAMRDDIARVMRLFSMEGA
jgi:fructose-bisphosphate aldolase class II